MNVVGISEKMRPYMIGLLEALSIEYKVEASGLILAKASVETLVKLRETIAEFSAIHLFRGILPDLKNKFRKY